MSGEIKIIFDDSKFEFSSDSTIIGRVIVKRSPMLLVDQVLLNLFDGSFELTKGSNGEPCIRERVKRLNISKKKKEKMIWQETFCMRTETYRFSFTVPDSQKYISRTLIKIEAKAKLHSMIREKSEIQTNAEILITPKTVNVSSESQGSSEQMKNIQELSSLFSNIAVTNSGPLNSNDPNFSKNDIRPINVLIFGEEAPKDTAATFK